MIYNKNDKIIHLVDCMVETVERLVTQNNELTDKLEACEDALRVVASYVAAGGYNAEKVDPKVFQDKIIWGIDQLTRQREIKKEYNTNSCDNT